MANQISKNKFSLDDLYTFIKTVEIGSFTHAAKFFSINTTTVARKISNLEDSLGVNLIERTNNSFHATQIGRNIIEQVKKADFSLDQLQQIVKNAVYNDSSPGTIFFSLPPGVGINHVSKHIHRFTRANPNIQLNISYQSKEPELVKDNIDVALIFYPSEKHVNQKIKRIAAFKVKLCCTTTYVQKYGIPQTPNDLINHQCVGRLTDNLIVRKAITFTHQTTGEIINAEMPNNITTNNLMNNVELIKSNEMIAAVWEKTSLPNESNFVQVLAEYEVEPVYLYLLKHPYRQDKSIDLLATFIEKIFKDDDQQSAN